MRSSTGSPSRTPRLGFAAGARTGHGGWRRGSGEGGRGGATPTDGYAGPAMAGLTGRGGQGGVVGQGLEEVAVDDEETPGGAAAHESRQRPSQTLS